MKTNFFKSAFYAGFIAGLIFVILEMALVPLFLGGSPWDPPGMIAAIVMGEKILPPPPTFDITIFLVAIVVHFVLSVIYAMVIGILVSGVRIGVAAIFGFIAGGILYLINFYGFTEIFPWFAMARNWVSIFSHVAFGLIAALVFKANNRKVVLVV